jgi:protein gp37
VELYFAGEVLGEVLRRRRPTRFFWCDMTDLFLAHHPDEWIDYCFAAMALTPWHTHQVLTKRADRLAAYFSAPRHHWSQQKKDQPQTTEWFVNEAALNLNGPDTGLFSWPLPNVWLGVSVENQKESERIEYLRRTPAAVRFISFEPLLEQVDAKLPPDPRQVASRRILELGWRPDQTHYAEVAEWERTRIHWAIAGGESGPHARPMHPSWARSLRDQCFAAGVSFFFKQWGNWLPIDQPWEQDNPQPKAANERWINLAGGHGFHGEDVWRVRNVGKKAAGRLLDGQEWHQFPPEVLS